MSRVTVATADELDAALARVTALETRVGKLETAAPAPTPTPTPTPTASIDLSKWKVTLPIDSSGGFTGTAKEVLQPELQTFSASPYFFKRSDGSLVFEAPVNGAVTSGSTYPRSELRQMTGTGGTSLAAWHVSTGQRSMRHKCRVEEVPVRSDGVPGRVIIGQIHGPNDEPCRIYYDQGVLSFNDDKAISGTGTAELNFVLKTATGTPTSIPLGADFEYEIIMNTTEVRVNAWHLDKTYTAASPLSTFWKDPTQVCYFKAGCYLAVTTRSGGTLGTGKGRVVFWVITSVFEAAAPAPAPTPAPTLDPGLMPAAPVNPTTVNVSAPLTITSAVSNRIYNVTASFAAPAITIGAGGSLTRCIVKCNGLVDIGIRGPGTCTDTDVRDAKYANYYDVSEYKGVCLSTRGGHSGHHLRGVVKLAADAMIKANDPANWGVYCEGMNNSQLLGAIVAAASGSYTFQGYESTLCMDNSNGNTLAYVHMQDLPGYIAAVNNYSNTNTFRHMYGKGKIGDPGLVFANGSHHNTVDKLEVKDVTMALRFGEIDDAGGGNPCPDNYVKLVIGDNMPYGAVQFQMGDRCRVDEVNVSNVDSQTIRGGISFSPPNIGGVRPVSGCSVGKVTMTGTLKPEYGVHFGVQASNNRVESGTVTFRTAKVLNEGSGNTATV